MSLSIAYELTRNINKKYFLLSHTSADAFFFCKKLRIIY